jgi:hypothetical protein
MYIPFHVNIIFQHDHRVVIFQTPVIGDFFDDRQMRVPASDAGWRDDQKLW